MHIVRDKKTRSTMKFATCVVCFSNIVLSALVLLAYRKGLLNSLALIIAPVLLFNAVFGFFYFRRFYILDYSVDSTGIKILSGQRVKKTFPWHSFNYVGELNSYGTSGAYGTLGVQGMIVCLPQPPKPVSNKDGDLYTFSRKGAIWIDYTPEDAQTMRPYYRGQLPRALGI